MSGWDRVFTFYNATSGNLWVPMRCIRTKDRSYIWNAWSDGQTQYRAENMNGLTWKAMLAAAQSDPAIKARTDFYLYRVPEEFYDLTGDRFERQNLIHDPSRQAEIASLRQELLALLQRTGDPLAEAFAQRDKPEILAAAKQKLREEYERPPKGKAKARKAAAKAARSPAKLADGKNLIALDLPQAIVATEPVTVGVQHQFPEAAGEQAITVTMLAGADNQRLERKLVHAHGAGEIEVTFAVPAEQSGQSIKFAAFVGEDFAKTTQHICSEPLTVRN